MIVKTLEVEAGHTFTIDIKARSYGGRWGCIAFGPDYSVRCPKAYADIPLRRFCEAVVAPYCEAGLFGTAANKLFDEIRDILNSEKPEDHTD